MFPAEIRHRPLVSQSDEDAPPHWAVVVVKICVVGLLLLPIASMLGLLLYQPSGDVNYRPMALLMSVGVWIGMWITAALITTTYPPVRPDEKR